MVHANGAPICLFTREEFRLSCTGRGKMEWISVKDRLPAQRETVLVFRDEGIYTAHLSIRNMWICTCECYEGSYANHVTHWMQLPKPPKGVA